MLAAAARGGDFADSVVAYAPAPGQFVNNALYNNPGRALGAPVGGGTASADNSKLVSLGGFGGTITLRFSPPVMDDPCNPFGLDAIVFGNALWVGGNANRRSCEVAVIEISRDVNGNGIADDPWYVIRGSSLPALPSGVHRSQAWDNNAGTPTPPSNTAWYPGPIYFPGFPAGYSTAGFELPSVFAPTVVENPLGLTATGEAYFGYGDFTPVLVLGDSDADNIVDAPGLTPGEFYTAPDNPFAVGITPGSGGGDALDIAWAVDGTTGAPARLEGFDFIRIGTGIDALRGVLGEASAEVGGVARVRARGLFFDANGDGRVDAEDLYEWHRLAGLGAGASDLNGDRTIGEADRALQQRCVRRGEPQDLMP